MLRFEGDLLELLKPARHFSVYMKGYRTMNAERTCGPAKLKFRGGVYQGGMV
jgi:hypothetical protein